jgi:AsmA protein
MRRRQSVWKWLLAGFVAAAAAGFLFLLLRPAGPPSDLMSRVEASLSDWTGGTVTLLEPLRVRYLPPSIEGGLSLSNAAKLPSVESMTVPKFRLTLSLPDLLFGNLTFSALRLDKPMLRLRGGSETRTAKTVLGRLTSFLASAPLDSMRLHRGVVDTSAGSPILRELDLRLNTRRQAGSLEAVGSFAFNGEDVTFSLDRGRTTIDAEGQGIPLTLKVTSAPLTARFSGTMQLAEVLSGEGNLEATLPDLRHFLNWVGVAVPKGESLKEARATGRASWAGPTLTFDDGEFEIDGNTAVGLLAITAGERPRIDGTLAFEALSLHPYLSNGSASNQDAPLLNWVILKHVDADLRISAAEFQSGDLQLGGGGLTLNARNGAISSEIGSLEVCGGLAEGRFNLDVSTPRVEGALAGSLTGVNIDVCREFFGTDVPVNGTGSMKIDLSTGGTSHDELIRGLAGTVVVAAENGSLPIDLMTLMSEPDAVARGWSQDANTAFSELKADCSLSAGHLWCKTFRLRAEDKIISGAGGLDVAQQTLDWDLRMTDPDTSQEANAGAAEAKSGVTISGPLMAPDMAHAGAPEREAVDSE